eukprot:171963-Pelagomonas_calceolata.AAC.7
MRAFSMASLLISTPHKKDSRVFYCSDQEQSEALLTTHTLLLVEVSPVLALSSGHAQIRGRPLRSSSGGTICLWDAHLNRRPLASLLQPPNAWFLS